MEKIMRSFPILLLWVVASLSLVAQATSQDEIIRADKQFDLYAYNLAFRSYEQILRNDPNNPHILARMADCKVQLNKPAEALPLYERATQQKGASPLISFRYGRALMMTGDYAGAKKWFNIFAESDPRTGKHFAEMCDYAMSLAAKAPLYQVRNEALNTDAADYGPAFLGNRLTYSSARTDIVRRSNAKNTNDWSGSAFNQLFVTQRNPETGYLQKPSFLRSDLQNAYNEGPVAYSSDGNMVFFCRNNFIDGSRQIADKGINLSLYIAEVSEGGSWINIRPFAHNGSDYSTGYPSISPDGQLLFFASNRPGGSGGWDIYVSQWNGSDWGFPQNLGPTLNTEGNEITPFFDGTSLFFSSDWHKGMGGMDIFRADVEQLQATAVYHLGPGINSSRDDYGFVYNQALNVGYFTSNRPDGRGNEDIWQAVRPQAVAAQTTPRNVQADAPQMYGLTPGATPAQAPKGDFYVYVADSWMRPVAGAEVDCSECNGQKGVTDEDGRFYFQRQNRPLSCKIYIAKDGYEELDLDIKSFGSANIAATISQDKKQEFYGVVYDMETKRPLSGVVVEYTAGSKTIQTSTSPNGVYSLQLTPRNTYDLTYSDNGYAEKTVRIRPGMPGSGNQIDDVFMEKETARPAAAAPARAAAPPPSASQPSPSAPVAYSASKPNAAEPARSPVAAPVVDAKPQSPAATSPVLLANRDPKPQTDAPKTVGYAIQLAATPDEITPSYLRKYEPLTKHGNLYAKKEGALNKLRLGIFEQRPEANRVLTEVKKDARYKDAYIVEEKEADESLMLRKAPATPAQYAAPTGARSALPPDNGIRYAVQLGSFSPENPISINNYAALNDLGNVYSKLENGMLKMRLGIWSKHADAENAQSQAVGRGFDAIIVTEKADDEVAKKFLISGARLNTPDAAPASPAAAAPAQYSAPAAARSAKGPEAAPAASAVQSKTAAAPVSGVGYEIRVCAMSDPRMFDANKIKGAKGKIEKRDIPNTTMSAVLLTGYASPEAAIQDTEYVRRNGFPDAYIMRVENGERKIYRYRSPLDSPN
ncbi:MAG: carboxypeptidase regulatory-like domain-containing protein [Saprospiraceae bacterium]